jgi:hypothetical protein
MSNKTTLQNNNTKISTNNTDLNAILNTINNLPAAGGTIDHTTEDAILTRTVSGNYVNNQITKVGYGAFYEDAAITGFSAANVETIAAYAFRGCSKITSLNVPKLKTVSTSSLYQVNVPNLILSELTSMGTYSFGGSSGMKTITLPKLLIVQSNGFRQNTGVTRIDLGVCTNIYATGFYNCYALQDLIIRTDSVCALANTNAFTGCSKLANIYVPDNLVNSYKAATNWSTYADKIKPISQLS